MAVRHCCESEDLMTPKMGQPESLEEHTLFTAEIGDIFIMDGSGAYCSRISTNNYLLRDAGGVG
jgi:diaminopimelate decarboxylase